MRYYRVLTDYVMPLFFAAICKESILWLLFVCDMSFLMIWSDSLRYLINRREWMNQKIPREEYNRIKIAIGENIRNLRSSRNWTQEELIERLELIGLSDISANTISRTENGHSMPNLITVIYLAKVYAVSIDSLISM